MLGTAYLNHTRAIIFRREYTELRGIIDRGNEIFGHVSGYNKVDKIWRFTDDSRKIIELGAVRSDGDESKFQGRPHDFKGFDEIQNWSEMQFRFLIGWTRSANPKQRCRVFCTGNPPTNSTGDWVIRYWAPWLDENHPDPAEPGELRWFSTGPDGEDIEVQTGEPYQDEDGEWIQPKSRTFIPAKVEDNPYLMSAGYKATLQSLPEPLRSKMLLGSFSAGREDDAYQVIPTEWVKLAQQRWMEHATPPKKGVFPDAIGVDIARGGKDKTVISRRYGVYFATQEAHKGTDTPDGLMVASLCANHADLETPLIVDIIGVGSSVYDTLRANQFNVIGFNGAEKSTAKDISGRLGFGNKRAEGWWKLREALDPDKGMGLMLPPTRELMSDLCAPRWYLGPRGVQIEKKEDIIKRIGRSPDLGDSLVYAFYVPQAVKARGAHINYFGR